MKFITIISDWGLTDYYLAAVKGKIYSYLPEARIVDISHEVPLYNYSKAAFLLRDSYPHFPKGTVHIIGVNAIESKKTPHVIVCHDGHYFIGADNGIFSLLFKEEPSEVYEISVYQDSSFYTFPCRDVFAKVACAILQGTPISELGTPSKLINISSMIAPARDFIRNDNNEVESAYIKGRIIHIDHYGNGICNIDADLFNDFRKLFQKFTIEIGSGKYQISKIHQAYSDVGICDQVALFGSNNLLQIALNSATAESLLGLRTGDSPTAITITFTEPK